MCFRESIEIKSKYDAKKEIMSLIMRDTLHNLDLSDKDNLELFNVCKLNYIALFEGEKLKAYDDAAGERHPYKYAEKIFAAG